MSKKRFTVIIPTRERADTLVWTLKTCTTQNYDNLEIIISDNFSQDSTKEVVESYQDSRIRYINPGGRVSMTENWEFALSHATGDYVTYIGDDDGLAPQIFEELNELLGSGKYEAIGWDQMAYKWLGCPDPINNTLYFFLENNVEKVDAGSMLEKICNFEATSANNLISSYEKLPGLYNGFIKRSLINKIKSLSKDNRFFHSSIPDVYSAVCIAAQVKSYLFSKYAYSFIGHSWNSGGASLANPQIYGNQAANKFLLENTIPFHKNIKPIYDVIPMIVAECIFQVLDNVSDLENDLYVNAKNLIEASLNYSSGFNEEKHKQALEKIRYTAEILGTTDLPNQSELVSEAVALPNHPFGYNPIDKCVYISGNGWDIKNVYDASILYDNIMKGKHQKYIFKEAVNYFFNFARQQGLLKALKGSLKNIPKVTLTK